MNTKPIAEKESKMWSSNKYKKCNSEGFSEQEKRNMKAKQEEKEMKEREKRKEQEMEKQKKKREAERLEAYHREFNKKK